MQLPEAIAAVEAEAGFVLLSEIAVTAGKD
jgi:hypothetical protein